VRETAGKRYRTAIVRAAQPSRRLRAFVLRLLGAALLSSSLPALAGLYKCARDDGTVMYQEDPCSPGKELRDFDRDPASVSVVPFRLVPGPEAPAPAQSRETPSGTTAKASGKGRKSTERTANASERPGNASERKFLVPGIGEGEVVARIGRPDMTTGAGRKTVRWTYMPVPEDPATITTLTFELGRLVQVERKVIRTP